MKTVLSQIFCFFCLTLSAQVATFELQGKVTDFEDLPLMGTNILIEGTSKGVKTDSNGAYSVHVKLGDVLLFSYVGMHTRKIPINEIIQNLNVQLFAKVQDLDEVQVKKRISKTQKELLAEYPTNKNLIKTSWGILSKDRSSYSMRMVDGGDILPTGIDFLTSLRSHFPNMIIDRETTPPTVYLRNLGQVDDSNPVPSAIFDVDGFIYEQAPTFIIPSEIERVAVIKRNGAMRYGPQGAGGVIIINTKEKTRIDDLGVSRVYDNNNLVDSLTQESNKTDKYSPKTFDFMKDFEKANSNDKAWRIYEDGKEEHSASPAYFFETSNYFWKEWQDEKKALAILETAKYKIGGKVELLKAIAYFSEEMGRTDLALQHYLDILKIRSSAAQSHRDMANAYNELGQYKKALLKYARYKKAVEAFGSVPFDSQGSDLIMSVESNNIIKQRQQDLEIDKEQLDQIMEVPKTRILLEWNIEDFDLEVQFIDPDDLYVLWNNYDRLVPEIEMARTKGYASKQFFLDDTLNGDWKLTLNYEYDKVMVPAVIKVTTFFDYGLPTQKSEFKILRLHNPESSFHLATINTTVKYVKY